jgi:hypothetical protein
MIIEKILKKILKEATTSTTTGEYSGPQELGMRKWKEPELGPFSIESDIPINKNLKKNTIKKNVKKIVGMWEKKENSYNVETHPVHSIKEKPVNEDLAVWFGKKKKPKGSSQPKGPWVNICRKVDGKHPPCGRPDADSKGYPKCRAAGVAGKMTDSEKKSACSQKRREEKKNPKSGKGNKPTMTSYKPRKESIREIIKNILKEEIKKPKN